jgi:hypothetical protein
MGYDLLSFMYARCAMGLQLSSIFSDINLSAVPYVILGMMLSAS